MGRPTRTARPGVGGGECGSDSGRSLPWGGGSGLLKSRRFDGEGVLGGAASGSGRAASRTARVRPAGEVCGRRTLRTPEGLEALRLPVGTSFQLIRPDSASWKLAATGRPVGTSFQL